MSTQLKTVSVLLCLLCQAVVGMHFSQEQFFQDGIRDANIPDQKLFGMKVKWGSCGRYVVKNLEGAGCRWPHHAWWKQFWRGGCHYQGGVPSIDALSEHADALQMTVDKWPKNGRRPQSMSDLRQGLGGNTPHFFIWRKKTGLLYPEYKGHAGKLFPDGSYGAHGENQRERPYGVFPDFFDQKWDELYVFNVPPVINNCNGPKDFWSADSTIGGDPDDQFRVRHQWTCCWKEKLAGEGPWTSRTSPYACLNWAETKGNTWDTLIGPRANLAGCTSVVFIQSCTTNLAQGSNTIEIRGSTDNGTTWPYLIGTHATKKADIDNWAAGQRDVRIAWIYKGSVQAGKFWCVDEIGLWTKPQRTHDASVSEVKCPTGTISQGKTLVPSAFVWNYGATEESIQVTFSINGYYTNTCWVKLPPICDTFVEFPSWTPTPGTYTAKCYATVSGDEVRANDTASVTFQVLANTWVKMFPIYGGGGMASGACLATVDSSQIYCATGRKNYFAKYLVRENLWKVMAPAPRAFMNGAALAYPGYGDSIYALRGGVSFDFYKYSISANKWTVIDNGFPERVGSGGSMAYGGAGWIYALRGRQSTEFYRNIVPSHSWAPRASLPGPAKVKQGASLV